MVRVLCCHHFAGQDVFNTDHEPLTLYSSGHRLFVASAQCCIHVYDLDQPGCPCVVHLPTIAEPKQILHCPKGNYLAAIEEKVSRHSSSAVVSVRFYLQWEKVSSNEPMRVRFAGSINSAGSDGLEIIEVPMLSHDPVFIACCQTTGNFAIAVNKLVKIYEVVEHHDENGSLYRDVEPLLDIRYSILLKQVSICEEFIAVTTAAEVHVVKLQDRSLDAARLQTTSNVNDTASSNVTKNDLADLHYSTNNTIESEIQTDPDFVEWDCIENENPSQFNSQGLLNTIVLQSKKVLDSQTSLTDIEILGPTVTEISGHPITIWYDGCVMQERIVTTLLYKSFVLSDDEDSTHSLQFVPLYKLHQEQEDATPDVTNGVLQSSDRSSLIGLCLFYSTTSVGYMYNILNTTELLSTYPYMAPASQVMATNGLVYAITNNGLEVYTCRGHAKAEHNVFTFNDVTQTCPPASLETCLIGMQPFMAIKCVSVSERHLVLLSKVSSTSGSSVNSSIYALKRCQVEELAKDLMALGSTHHQSSPPAYLQLLEEAYLCLRGYLLEHGTGCQQLMSLYAESSALLGDYYIRADTEEARKLTLPYYITSGYSPSQVIGRLIGKHRGVSMSPPGATTYSPGILHYLDYIMFKDDSLLLMSEMSTQCCDKILDIYQNLKPQALSDVVLKSKFHGYSCEKATTVLQGISKKNSPAVSLALVFVYLKDCNFDSAKATLLAIQEKDITTACLENHHLLYTKYKQLTPLSQLVKKHRPQVFASIWNVIYTQHLMNMDTIIKILQSSSPGTELHKNIHLVLFLENLLINDQENLSPKSEIAELLCHIYMERLLEPAEKSINSTTVNSKTFLTRFSWMNALEPFNGDVPSNKCMHLKDSLSRVPSVPKLMPHTIPTRQASEFPCSCWNCNQDLIKIQALLCSKLVPPQAIRKVLSMAADSDIKGNESIHILCTAALSIEEAVEIVIDKHTNVLVKFVIETIGYSGSLDQWRHVITCLSCLLKDGKIKQDDAAMKEYVTAFQGVLSFLSDSMAAGEFFTLIPPDVSLGFVLPFVKRSCHKYLASKLKADIQPS